MRWGLVIILLLVATMPAHGQAKKTGRGPGPSQFQAPGAGALIRSLSSKLGDVISVLDYTGVDPTGVADSTAGIQAAIDANKRKTILLPAGSYNVTKLALIGSTYNNSQLLSAGATLNCVSGTATECIEINGTTGVEISGDLLIRPVGASYIDTIKIVGGNHNRILPGTRIGFFNESPAPFTTDIAWGYYSGNSVNGIRLLGATGNLSFYNSVDSLHVKSLGGFALVIEAGAATNAIANGNTVRGLNVLGRNGIRILGGWGNYIDAESMECTGTVLYFDAVGTTAATDNRLTIGWSEYAQTPIFWGTTTAASKGNVVAIAHAGVHYSRPYYAVPRPGGTNNTLIQNPSGINSNRQKMQATGTGSPIRLETVWGEDDALTYGPELFTDGTAEANSAAWTSVGTVTQTQSTEQAHSGSFSRKVVTGAVAGQNGVQETITTVVGTVYRFSFWIYLLSPSFDVTVDYNQMNAFAGPDFVGFRRGGINFWQRVVVFTRASTTSTIFKWVDQGSTALTWYLDDVSVQAVTGGATGHLAEWGEDFGQQPRAISGYVGLDGSIGATGVVLSATTFANLGAGSTANGTLLYCSDCTIASPCASGGTGALAKRLNATWVCN